MSNYTRFLEPRRRGVILAILHQSNADGCSVPALASVVQHAGYRASREMVEADLQMLSDLGLLVVRDVGGVAFARITVRGVDVATGNQPMPGIERCSDEF